MGFTDRVRHWMDSDLVGIPVALAAAAVVAATIVGFYVAGSLGGVLFAVLGLGLVALLVIRPGSAASAEEIAEARPPGAEVASAGGGHRVLVIANHALTSPRLTDRLEEIAAMATTEIRIIAPAEADSRLHALADDVDDEIRGARARLESLMATLRTEDVSVSGHVDEEAGPAKALLDGLREFAATKVILAPGAERGWPEASELGARLREDKRFEIVELRG
jgi:hypothetical protein